MSCWSRLSRCRLTRGRAGLRRAQPRAWSGCCASGRRCRRSMPPRSSSASSSCSQGRGGCSAAPEMPSASRRSTGWRLVAWRQMVRTSQPQHSSTAAAASTRQARALPCSCAAANQASTGAQTASSSASNRFWRRRVALNSTGVNSPVSGASFSISATLCAARCGKSTKAAGKPLFRWPRSRPCQQTLWPGLRPAAGGVPGGGWAGYTQCASQTGRAHPNRSGAVWGGVTPRWRNAACVAMRPRGVRCRNPCWIR